MFKYSKDGIIVSSMLDTRVKTTQNEYPVKIRVNYNQVRVYYPTGKTMTRDDWEKFASAKSSTVKSLRESIGNSFSLVRNNVQALAEKGDFSFDALNLRLGKATGDTVNNAIKAKIDKFLQEDRIGSMQLLENTLVLVEQVAGKSIQFNEITVQWLKRCEQEWLKTKNLNTIGMHMRNIRTIMNEAKKAGVIKEGQYPFGKDRFEIKTGTTHKKALTLAHIRDIFQYSDGNETTDRYKDLWIFIYLFNGINVADLIKLKYSNIIDREIYYIRQKTERTTKNRKEIGAFIVPEMQAIIDKWGNPVDLDNYIFPYLKGNETPLQRKDISKDVTKRINKRMKHIGKELGIGDVTTYVARHSFATVLKRSGANISYISESLGHSDLKTTEAYLANFEKGERTKNAHLLTNFNEE